MEEQFCGCTCHPIDPNDNNNVLMNGKLWNPICALKDSVYTLAKTQEELSKLRDELQVVKDNYEIINSQVQSIQCPMCFRTVKSRWVIEQGHICCMDCVDD